MEQTTEAISINLKKMREERGLSLDGLATRTGVSKSMLRQIEIGRSSPTIATIWKIANGLKVSFTSLLQYQEIIGEVRSFTQDPPLTAESRKYRLYPLVPFDPQRGFETYYVEMDAGVSFVGEPHEGNVFEFMFILAGKLSVTTQGKEFVAKEGEFLKFLADKGHTYLNIGTGILKAIMTISYAI